MEWMHEVEGAPEEFEDSYRARLFSSVYDLFVLLKKL